MNPPFVCRRSGEPPVVVQSSPFAPSSTVPPTVPPHTCHSHARPSTFPVVSCAPSPPASTPAAAPTPPQSWAASAATSLLPLSPIAARLVAGSVGSIVTVGSLMPLDVVKTRLQANATLAAMSLPRAVSTLVRTEGISALYAGWVPSFLVAVPSVTIYYAMYDGILTTMRAECDPASSLVAFLPLVAGSGARTLTSTLSAPLELVRTKLMAGVGASTMIGSLRQELKLGGLPRLFAGLGPTLLRDVPFSAIYWMMYEAVRPWVVRSMGGNNADDELLTTFLPSFLSGTVSGTFAALVTCPFDVIKTHRQAGDPAGVGPRSTWSALQGLYAKDGLSALFVGALPRCARVAPACAIMIGTYDLSKAYLLEH